MLHGYCCIRRGNELSSPSHSQSTGPLDAPYRRKCMNSKDLQVANPVDRPLSTGPLVLRDGERATRRAGRVNTPVPGPSQTPLAGFPVSAEGHIPMGVGGRGQEAAFLCKTLEKNSANSPGHPVLKVARRPPRRRSTPDTSGGGVGGGDGPTPVNPGQTRHVRDAQAGMNSVSTAGRFSPPHRC
jgi:hypothetical protein